MFSVSCRLKKILVGKHHYPLSVLTSFEFSAMLQWMNWELVRYFYGMWQVQWLMRWKETNKRVKYKTNNHDIDTWQEGEWVFVDCGHRREGALLSPKTIDAMLTEWRCKICITFTKMCDHVDSTMRSTYWPFAIVTLIVGHAPGWSLLINFSTIKCLKWM